MAGPGVLSHNVPAVPTPIGVSDVSPAQSYLLLNATATADRKYLWWKFTAPADGLFAFDPGMSTVGGAPAGDPDWESKAYGTTPYIEIALWEQSGTVTDLGLRPYDGTQLTWSLFQMTAGSTVTFRVHALSTSDDFYAGTNVPVSVVFRSNRLDSVTMDAPADMEFVDSGYSTGSTVNLGTLGRAGDILVTSAVLTTTDTSGNMPEMTFPAGVVPPDGEVVSGGDFRFAVNNQAITRAYADITVDAPGALSVNYFTGSNTVTHWSIVRFSRPLSPPGSPYHYGGIGARIFAGPGPGDYSGGNTYPSDTPPYVRYGGDSFEVMSFGVGWIISGDGTAFEAGDVNTMEGITEVHRVTASGVTAQTQLLSVVPSPLVLRRVPPTRGKLHDTTWFYGPPLGYSLDPFIGIAPAIVAVPRVRQFPRNDGLGLSSSPRVHSQHRPERIVGGMP